MKKIILIIAIIFTFYACDKTEIIYEDMTGLWDEKIEILRDGEDEYFLLSKFIGSAVDKETDDGFKVGTYQSLIVLDSKKNELSFYDNRQNREYIINLTEYPNSYKIYKGKLYTSMEVLNTITFRVNEQLYRDDTNNLIFNVIDYDKSGLTVEGDEISKEEKLKLFYQVLRAIDLYYPIKKEGLSKKELEEKYLKKVEETKGREEFSQLMLDLVDDFNNGHIGYRGSLVNTYSEDEEDEILTGLIEGYEMIFANTALNFDKGFKLYYQSEEVIKVNGDQIEYKNFDKFIEENNFYYYQKWARQFKGLHSITLESGKKVELPLDFKKGIKGFLSTFEELPFKLKEVSEDLIVMDIDTWDFDVELLSSLKEKLKDKDIIIDLRGNLGGFVRNVGTLLEVITPLEVVAYTKTIPTGEVVEEKIRTDYGLKTSLLPANGINNRLVLLTDNDSYSASNNFAALFEINKLGEIIGEKTGGGNYRAQPYVLSDGSVLLLPYDFGFCSIDGYDYEGGVKPTIEINPQVVDGVDLAMEKAFEVLGYEYDNYKNLFVVNESDEEMEI